MTGGFHSKQGFRSVTPCRSDDFGFKVAEQPISVHDFHATVLHLLGIDHKRLTYLFNGRNMRLTDVHGELIPQIAG